MATRTSTPTRGRWRPLAAAAALAALLVGGMLGAAPASALGAWQARDLNKLAPVPDHRSDSPLNSVDMQGLTRIYFINASGQVQETGDLTDGSWYSKTIAAGAPLAEPGSALSSYVLDTWYPNVVYTAANQHVIRLRWTGAFWETSDLSAQSGAPLARHQSPLSTTFEGTNLSRVYYVDAVLNRVVEIGVTPTGRWVATAITPPGSPGLDTSLAAGRTSSSRPYVVYTTKAGDIMQAFWNGSTWSTWDMTATYHCLPVGFSKMLSELPLPDYTYGLTYFFDQYGWLEDLRWGSGELGNYCQSYERQGADAAVGSTLGSSQSSTGPEPYWVTGGGDNGYVMTLVNGTVVDLSSGALDSTMYAHPASSLSTPAANTHKPRVYFFNTVGHLAEISYGRFAY